MSSSPQYKHYNMFLRNTIKSEYQKPNKVDHSDLINALEIHTKVFIIADKYDVPPLRSLAVANYKNSVSATVVERPAVQYAQGYG